MKEGVQVLTLLSWEEKILTELHKRDFTDGSHDMDHFKRVTHRAIRFNETEQLGGDPLTILAAGLLHDMVEVPKDSPDRSKASRFSADAAIELLQTIDFPAELLEGVHHAIHAHSYTAQITPTTPEAKCIQDADRVEALGALGIVRCFYTAGRIEGELVNWEDPLATNRPLNDAQWSLDHFEVKLFHIPGMMQTLPGKVMAESLCDFMREFREKMITGGPQSAEFRFSELCAMVGRESKLTQDEVESVVDWVVKFPFEKEMRYFLTQFIRELEQ